LKVSGLGADNYILKIDGEEVGSFTKADLAAGVNLVNYATPMSKQAVQVHNLTLQHNTIHADRWRKIQVPMAGYDSNGVQKAVNDLMAALDKQEAVVVKEQRAAAQPRKHQFQLVAK
jgi:hypothetical protein